jgi:hypothetical protein
MGRAAVRLSVHERLVDLAAAHGSATLDGIPRSEIVGSPMPPRAVTLLDLERTFQHVQLFSEGRPAPAQPPAQSLERHLVQLAAAR